MLVLCIDTSNSFSLSLFNDGCLLGCFDYFSNSSSSLVIHCFNDLLKKSGINVNDIDYIGVGVGPGSYTGIRVGYCFSIGLCQALGIKMVAVNILEAISYYLVNIYRNVTIYPIINANNDNLYTIINGVVVKISLSSFQKLLLSSERIVISLLDNKFEGYFTSPNVKVVKIHNISEALYCFITKKIKENNFCDIYKYKIDYFDTRFCSSTG